MRILHTADLHLGHSLNGWDRAAEHRLWFAQLADLVEAEQVDLLLIAGDIYDITNPSGDVQKLLFEALTTLKSRRPSLTTIISGGNHDPVQKLDAPGVLLEAFDVHVIGKLHYVTEPESETRQVDLARHMIPVSDATGTPCVHVLAIPFLRSADLPGLSFGQSSAPGTEGPVVTAAREFLADLTGRAAAQIPAAHPTPMIAMAHLHCAGGLESEGAERRIIIGGDSAVPPDVFPAALDYVALGHLHRPQNLDGGRVRYSGSCFALSASEITYDHGVTLIDVEGSTLSHRHIPIPRPAPIFKLPRPGTQQRSLPIDNLPAQLNAIEVDEQTPMDLRPLVYIELQATDAASVLTTQAAAQVKERGLRLAGIRVRREASTQPAHQTDRPPMISLKDTDPETLFKQAYEARNGLPPEPRHLTAFRDARAG